MSFSEIPLGFGIAGERSGSRDGEEPDHSVGRAGSGRGVSSSSSSSSDDDGVLVDREFVPLVKRPRSEVPFGDLACARIESQARRRLVRGLRKDGKIGDIEVAIPKSGWRAHRPPVGYVTLYEEHFKVGLKLPISPFFSALLDHFELALCQITPNALAVILNFISACDELTIPCTLELFLYIFSFRPTGKGYVAIYAAKGVNYEKGGKKVPSHGDWKLYFFYARGEDVGHNRGWGRLSNTSFTRRPNYFPPGYPAIVRNLKAIFNETGTRKGARGRVVVFLYFVTRFLF